MHRAKPVQWDLRVTEAVEDSEESLVLREMPALQDLRETWATRETKVFRVLRVWQVLSVHKVVAEV